MVFTPLLASTCVETLELRSVVEPVTQIQTALAKDPNSYFFLASCTGLDTDKHENFSSYLSKNELQDTFRGRVCRPVVQGVKFSSDGYTHCEVSLQLSWLFQVQQLVGDCCCF